MQVPDSTELIEFALAVCVGLVLAWVILAAFEG